MANVALNFGLALGSSQTGLVLQAQLVDSSGNPSGAAVTTGFTEIGVGNYIWAGSVPQGFQGGVVFAVSGGTPIKAFVALNPSDTEQALIGPGGSQCTFTVQDIGSNPLAGALVWITTDTAGNNIVAGTLVTDTFGHATFFLQPGTYYAWVQKPRYTVTNPTQITVT